MYQVKPKRKKGALCLLLFASIAIGLGIGYAGARLASLPPEIHAETEQDALALPEAEAPLLPSRSVALQTELPQIPAEEGYWVQASGETVSVYQIAADGSRSEMQTFSVTLGDLPESDRIRLKNGIFLKTKTELLELMEDYGS